MTFPEWATPAPLPHPDTEARGIFCWMIGGDAYVGKSERLARSLREYEKNISRLENGEAYRPGNENGFRAVHRAIFKAKQGRRPIIWLVLEICKEDDDLNMRRAYWIQKLQPSLNGADRTIEGIAHD